MFVVVCCRLSLVCRLFVGCCLLHRFVWLYDCVVWLLACLIDCMLFVVPAAAVAAVVPFCCCCGRGCRFCCCCCCFGGVGGGGGSGPACEWSDLHDSIFINVNCNFNSWVETLGRVWDCSLYTLNENKQNHYKSLHLVQSMAKLAIVFQLTYLACTCFGPIMRRTERSGYNRIGYLEKGMLSPPNAQALSLKWKLL